MVAFSRTAQPHSLLRSKRELVRDREASCVRRNLGFFPGNLLPVGLDLGILFNEGGGANDELLPFALLDELNHGIYDTELVLDCF